MSKAQDKLAEVTVRMYRQGLGDCFLLTFRSTEGAVHHMLIDCGVLQGSKGASDRLRKIASDILAATGNHLHTVVATHEHWDHISGFFSAKKIFGLDTKTKPATAVTVGEVWLPWTENLEDSDVQRLVNKNQKMTVAITAAVSSLGEKHGRAVNEILRFGGNALPFGVKSTTNGKAHANEGGKLLKEIMDGLRGWGQPVYLEPDDVQELADLGVKIYILGPSRKLSQFGRQAKDSAGGGSTLKLNASTAFLAAAVKNAGLILPETDDSGLSNSDIDEIYRLSLPFDEARSIDLKDAPSNEDYGSFYKTYYGDGGVEEQGKEWRRIDKDWLQMAENFALQQVSNVNNTSLVMAIELTENGKVLLFPADAQEESWETWENKHVNLDDFYKRTVFYKVGHHGSVNATLLNGGLDKMTNQDLVAMIPVDKVRAKKNEWNFPEENLMKALTVRTKGRIILNCEKDCQSCDPSYDELKFGNIKINRDPSKDKLWVEYTIKP